MKVHELFANDVTRDIPPVVYFHEQSPEKLKAEVGEYIVTGGYLDGDPRAQRIKGGIHEELVRLLQNIQTELEKKNGPELPASWISGFYGSGKSSFAKLLGLALDGAKLPDGTSLADALLARDDSPRRQELVDAWSRLVARVNPIAVVFDIGGVARDDEHIHSAVLRQVQRRLGYCPKSNLVADYELSLERDGDWPRFLKVAQQTLGKPWEEAMREEQAEDHFSHVLHVLNPERYRDPMSWIDSRAGARTGAGTASTEVVNAIDGMLALRAEARTLFIVVDEVSQYVHQDPDRMLKLQSFVSDLGAKMKGVVWLLATGQQKLEDQAEGHVLGKLKDRFPPQLRVHLGTTNIRDVVHKRLLKKRPDCESRLRELFQKHRGDLKLHGYACEDITEEDFVEVYPMLPGQVDLLMQITSNLRTRSSRIQGDDHAIRGLLQLLGELFREQKLADRPVGALVTLDSIYEVQHTALDADVQTTLARIFAHADVREDLLAQRAAKAVALLELIQEQTPTTAELVAQCLYSELGEGNRVQQVTAALEKLKSHNLLSYSEKQGYKIQSSAGQEWEKERADIGVTLEQISESVQAALQSLVGDQQERPKMKGRSFPWTLRYSDGKRITDAKLQDAREDATVTVDFRFLANATEREQDQWVTKSAHETLANRLLWVVGSSADIEAHGRELGRSAKMVERFKPRRDSLSRDKLRLLIDEEARMEELESRFKKTVAEAFVEGRMYFRGQSVRARDLGAAFGPVLLTQANRLLPELYPRFLDLAVSPSELAQLLEPTLNGPSTKFMEGGLGLLSMDAGKYLATCDGVAPTGMLKAIRDENGLTGQALISTFVAPPYGYGADVVKACVAGLLRGKKIRVRPEQGEEISSHTEPGTRELFGLDRSFRRAELFPALEGDVTQRDRIALRSFFATFLKHDVEPEDDALTEAAFNLFPNQRERVRDVERALNELPGRPELPPAIERLSRALAECVRSRQVAKTVTALKNNLEALRDGLEQLGILAGELDEASVRAVNQVARVRDQEALQLRQMDMLSDVEDHIAKLDAQLASDRPWRGVHQLAPDLAHIRERYQAVRKNLLARHAEQSESARAQVKLRAGFEQLSSDESNRVLRPITEAWIDTTEEAVAPSLSELRDRFASRIGPALEDAHARLDELLSEKDKKPVHKAELHLRGREVSSRQELRAVFQEIEDRLGPELDKGTRIRLG